MNEPRRLKLNRSAAQRLLDSASLDEPGGAARRRAALLVSTTGGLSRRASGVSSRGRGTARTFLTFMGVAAAVTLPLAFVASSFSDQGSASHTSLAAPALEAISAEGPADERFIEAARGAVARRDYAAALAALDALDRLGEHGVRRPEALSLRIRALVESGKEKEATAVTRSFELEYPGHPLLPQRP